MNGNPDITVYDFMDNKIIATGYPVFVLGKSVYYAFVTTPFTTIYSHIDNNLLNERIQSYALLAGFTIAVVFLIIVLIKWNTILDNQVKNRTKELDISNKNLELTAKELKRTNESLVRSNELLDRKMSNYLFKIKCKKSLSILLHMRLERHCNL